MEPDETHSRRDREGCSVKQSTTPAVPILLDGSSFLPCPLSPSQTIVSFFLVLIVLTID